MIGEIKKWIDSWNINFLLGSGLSRPLLWTLQNIETSLTEAEDNNDTSEINRLKNEYFTRCMIWNIKVIDEENDEDKDETLENYKNFYKIINNILLKRENSILTKQVNVFTTNIDILSEKALEETWLEYNDWFHWKMNPKFDVWNFKKSIYKKSLHYENTSEIPIFNILKIHGSLSWNQDIVNRKIFFDRNLEQVKELNRTFDLWKYDDLTIVNPKKTKFEDTVLNQYYYDLLRLYSNELEKENSLLFVMWFSFADEHIRDLTLRVANSNPTLKVYIFKYSPRIDKTTLDILKLLRFDWIETKDELKEYIETFKKEDWKDIFIIEEEYDYIYEKLIIELEEVEKDIKRIKDYIINTFLFDEMINDAKNKNIEIVYPEWEHKYDFKTINEEIFEKIVPYDEKKELINNNTENDW